jgi:hypothetical protein
MSFFTVLKAIVYCELSFTILIDSSKISIILAKAHQGKQFA